MSESVIATFTVLKKVLMQIVMNIQICKDQTQELTTTFKLKWKRFVDYKNDSALYK